MFICIYILFSAPCEISKTQCATFTMFMPDLPKALATGSTGWNLYAINVGYEKANVVPLGTTPTTTAEINRDEIHAFKVLTFGDPTVNQPQLSKGVSLSCTTGTNTACPGLKVYAALDVELTGTPDHICGVTAALPDNTLSNDYRVLSVLGKTSITDSFGVIGIMSTTAATVVTVTLPTGGCPKLTGGTTEVIAGTPKTITLVNLRDTITLKCSEPNWDISGVRVTAPYGKKLVVYSGVRQTDLSSATTTKDMIWEQMFPLTVYGMEFVVGRALASTKSYFKIMAREDATVVTVQGTAVTLAAGGVYPTTGLPLEMDGPVYITASKAIMVASFTPGAATSTDGQPSFAMLPSAEQWQSAYTFHLPALNAPASKAYLSLSTKLTKDTYVWATGAAGFKLLSGTWVPIASSPAPAWQALTVEIVNTIFDTVSDLNSAKVIVVKNNEAQPFGAMVSLISTGTGTCARSFYAGGCLQVRHQSRFFWFFN